MHLKALYPLVVILALAGCLDGKPPHSYDALKADAKLTVQERGACDAGQYDGKPWKADYCGTVHRAEGAHMRSGRMLLNGTLVESDYTYDQLQADASITLQELAACKAGKYDGKAWGRSYCGDVDRAHRLHIAAGRLQEGAQ